MTRFLNKVVIITGASSGIGEAAAIDFAKERARLVIAGRNRERLENTAKTCKAHGAEVHEFVGDLAEFDNLELLIKEAVDKFEGIDVLVNNAALGHHKLMEQYAYIYKDVGVRVGVFKVVGLGISEMSGVGIGIGDKVNRLHSCSSAPDADSKPSYPQVELEDFEKIFKINLRAPVFLSKFALPYLKISKGCIVNVSSCASLMSVPGSVTYSMTKAALDHYSRGFSAECAEYGVRINTINPAVVPTRFAENSGVSKADTETMMANICKAQPFGAIDAHQVSDGIMYLCSSGMTTGVTLPIDGGLLHSSKFK